MKVTEIKDTSLWLSMANYYICEHCRAVDPDICRTHRGHRCPICSRMSDTGQLFFDINVLTLIDLIQEAFHTRAWKESEFGNKKISVLSLSVLIFFCTLREVLLESLIFDFMCFRNLPTRDRDRLYDKSYFEKTKLFSSLVGLKGWDEVLSQLKAKTGRDYRKFNGFLVTAAKMRNQILHGGDTGAFRSHMKKACLENIPELLELYVDFHNTFIHPEYLEKLENA